MYLVKTPWLLKKWYPNFVWNINNSNKSIYLTFDDGPHPTITPNVLHILKSFNAKATFFCIGKNVTLYPQVFEQIISQGHTIGNHTEQHLNGWQTDDALYVKNIDEAATKIDSQLFRPPYGRITKFQAKLLTSIGYKIVMWNVLSGDFDVNLSKEKCAENVLLNTTDGSIIVFHDSEKANERMVFALTKTLEHFSRKGYEFSSLDYSAL